MQRQMCCVVILASLIGITSGCGGGGQNTTLKNDPAVSKKNEEMMKAKMEEAMKNRGGPSDGKSKPGGNAPYGPPK